MSEMSKKIDELKDIFCKKINNSVQDKLSKLKEWNRNNLLQTVVQQLEPISLKDYSILETFPDNTLKSLFKQLTRYSYVSSFEIRDTKRTPDGVIPQSISISVIKNDHLQNMSFEGKAYPIDFKHEIPFFRCNTGYILDLSNKNNFDFILNTIKSNDNPLIGYKNNGCGNFATPVFFNEIHRVILPTNEEIDIDDFIKCVDAGTPEKDRCELFRECMSAQVFLDGLMYCPEKQMVEVAEQISILYQIGDSEGGTELMNTSKFCMKVLTFGFGDSFDRYYMPSICDVVEGLESNDIEGPYTLRCMDGDKILVEYDVNIVTNDIVLENKFNDKYEDLDVNSMDDEDFSL